MASLCVRLREFVMNVANTRFKTKNCPKKQWICVIGSVCLFFTNYVRCFRNFLQCTDMLLSISRWIFRVVSDSRQFLQIPGKNVLFSRIGVDIKFYSKIGLFCQCLWKLSILLKMLLHHSYPLIFCSVKYELCLPSSVEFQKHWLFVTADFDYFASK